jgi:hypothetical protein
MHTSSFRFSTSASDGWILLRFAWTTTNLQEHCRYSSTHHSAHASLETTGALYAFASPDSSDLDPRADFDTITEILQETLRSYRLLFGQKQASRKYFKQLAGSNSSLIENPDPFLFKLCATKLFTHPLVPQDRFTYFAHRDFPVLGERVEPLKEELRGTKPKDWKGLVRDNRDTTQYWTF